MNFQTALSLVLLSLSSAACYLALEPLQEARYRDKGDKIKRSDAVLLIQTSVFVQAQRCGHIDTSFVLMLNPGRIRKSACPGDVVSLLEENPNKGCADDNFLDRSEIETCRVLVEGAPCHNFLTPLDSAARANSGTNLIIGSLCLQAFRL